MTAEEFCRLAENLTGTPVKGVLGLKDAPTTRNTLAQLLQNEGRVIEHSQLNELLLLVNKDRMEAPFFDRFFGVSGTATGCTVGDLRDGVARFQMAAMLCYGNFIHAYRKLSRLAEEELAEEIGDWAREGDDVEQEFTSRNEKLVDIEPISRKDTPLVGYLSSGEIVAEAKRADRLHMVMLSDERLPQAPWDEYTAEAVDIPEPNARPGLRLVIAKFRARHEGATVADFAKHLAEVAPELKKRDQLLEEVQAKAIRNQGVYLTWDQMDIYFATSMRKRWEFESLHDFVSDLMATRELVGVRGEAGQLPLNLRHFDPTQALMPNRIDKGLIEALMLKRARCTVYSVQDTDTLGKDSELAATLAQGKPVIAYVPEIDVDKQARKLSEGVKQDPAMVPERLRFVAHADDKFSESLQPGEWEFLRRFTALEDYERSRVWKSVVDAAATHALHKEHKEEIDRVCRIVAESEKRIYDNRHRTLKETHPLAIQVNLDTGVANGVLVVRTVKACAELLRAILTNRMKFDVQEDDNMWYLRERISGCIFRVVTKDRKLTNCFWNFYPST